jgi:hypothetical protein
MCGRAAVPSLLVLLFSLEVQAQCNWTPRYSGQFRTTAFDIATDGDGFLWLATGYGVQLLRETGGAPEPLDSAAVPGSTRVIAANGAGLAYAGSGSRVFVIRRAGSKLEVVRSIDAGAIVNDIAVTSRLFVATRNGIVHYDLLDPTNPVPTNVSLFTTKPNVTSLAVSGSTLYAADGDDTVEVYNISVPSLPQRTGTLTSHARSSVVHVTQQGLLFVSDDAGQNTDVFGSTGRIARVPFGSISFAGTADGGHFVAGLDRTVRAVDFSVPARPAELFERQLAPTGGTNNSIYALERSGNRVYVAAGDIGLVTLDVSTFAAPYPLLSYGGGATTSSLLIGERVWFTDAAGTITEYALPSLTSVRSFSGGAEAILQDGAGDLLLYSGGSNVILSRPDGTQVAQSSYRAAVKKAVHADGGPIVTLLVDGSVWSAPASAGSSPVGVAGLTDISSIARAGQAIAAAQILDNGTTVVRYYATSVGAEPRVFTIDGVATGGLALNESYAAIFTFRGVNLVDLGSGAVSVIPDSTRLIPKQMAFAGSTLLLLGDDTLQVWNTNARQLEREHTLPVTALSMSVAGERAAIATSVGTMAVRYAAALPSPIGDAPGNRYYTRAVAAADRLYLLGDSGVDVLSTAIGFAPAFVSGIRTAGVVDIAATDDGLFTLSSNSTVVAYSRMGVALAQTTINEASDQRPLALAAAGDVLWVSMSRGCLTGGCQKKTLVLDPRSLLTTSSLSGGVIDVVTSGTRAYALFDLPAEMRVLNIADPLHPSQVVAAASPANASTIGYWDQRVFVLGEKVFAFRESTLLPDGEHFDAAQGRRLRTTMSCAVLTGEAGAGVYRLPQWSAVAPATELPSPVRTIAHAEGRLFILTDHSVEVWSSTDAEPPAKRRAIR